MDGRSVFLQAKEKADTRILKPVSLTGGATSYLLQPYLLPGGVGMAFYSCHFFFIERLTCSGLLRSNESGCEVHRRCAGDEALYDSGFKNIIRTEVPALLLKRGREKKNPTTDFFITSYLQSCKIPKGRQLGGSDESFILFFKVKRNRTCSVVACAVTCDGTATDLFAKFI